MFFAICQFPRHAFLFSISESDLIFPLSLSGRYVSDIFYYLKTDKTQSSAENSLYRLAQKASDCKKDWTKVAACLKVSSFNKKIAILYVSFTNMEKSPAQPEFEAYLEQLGKLSNVKLLILKTLWMAGDTFPRNWVKSQKLLSLTDQKYFDRRIRELHDQLGCDIETQYHEGGHAYRLNSLNLKKSNPRHYLTGSQKKLLFEKCANRCQVCNKVIVAGVKGLQADHKIPLSRGGSHEEDNWQPLCNSCNVSKRSACAGCDLDCHQCPWAFPEKLGPLIVIRIPKSLADKARAGQVKLTQIESMLLHAWDEYEARKKNNN